MVVLMQLILIDKFLFSKKYSNIACFELGAALFFIENVQLMDDSSRDFESDAEDQTKSISYCAKQNCRIPLQLMFHCCWQLF